LLLCGCAGGKSYFGPHCLANQLEERTGHRPSLDACREGPSVPPLVDVEDGITEQEAVALALWNNPEYRELLAELGISLAGVIEAGQLANPDFSVMFPVGVKQLEFALSVPLEAVWLRPERLAAAETESQRIGNQLVQDGLNLVRDVRVAFADLALADERFRLADENARLRKQITELAEARLRAGSASELDVMTARIDQLMEEQGAEHATHDVQLARERLRYLLGVGLTEIEVNVLVAAEAPEVDADPQELVDKALAARPDLWASEFALTAACQRARLAEWDYLKVAGIFPDANGRGTKGFEAGPGLAFTVPILNRNQGAKARAAADVEKARRGCETLRQRIVLEVRQAHVRVVQAREDLDRWRTAIRPASEEAVATSEQAYRDGGASLLLMLLNSRQLLDSQLRQAEATAELRKAVAELERSVAQPLEETGDLP
jgi:cobalt-zinc-cadmium efflux system outer membrane protein